MKDEKIEPFLPQPQLWKDKEKNIEVTVTPWWELLPNDEVFNIKIGEYNAKFGKMACLAQVGWFLQHPDGMFIGVHIDTQKEFNFVRYLDPKEAEDE